MLYIELFPSSCNCNAHLVVLIEFLYTCPRDDAPEMKCAQLDVKSVSLSIIRFLSPTVVVLIYIFGALSNHVWLLKCFMYACSYFVVRYA